MGAPLRTPATDRRRAAIARRIKAARVARQMTVVAAAEQIGTSFWTMRRWEAGTHSVPAELMPAVATALDVTVEHLLGTATDHQVAA